MGYRGRMNQQEKYIMYQRIKKHGDNLKAIFNLDIDSVKLCKQLFRLENKAHKLTTDYCNGDIEEVEFENKIHSIKFKVFKILCTPPNNIYDGHKRPLYFENAFFVNNDARGYALKLKSEFITDKKIYRDMGGYGIIAPDFREHN
jgi:hypothetical protein